MTVPQKRGRLTVRTPDRAAILIEALGRGCPVKVACSLADIPVCSFYRWRESDRGFDKSIQQSFARGVETRLKIIEQAAQKDWRASLAWLQACVPEFAKHKTVEQLHLTQNNITIPRELLDSIAESRKAHEQKAIET